MEMIWPTLLVLLGTALIGWGLFALIAYLERLSGGGHGHHTQKKEKPEQ
ncbi:hypothetical protein [Deinococcus xinjiangensis]